MHARGADVVGRRAVSVTRVGLLEVGRTRRVVGADGRHRTSARFSWGMRSLVVHFETDASVPFLDENLGDLWVAPGLLVAMREGLDLRLRDPISNHRRANLDVVQGILSTWFPDRLRKVQISAPRGVAIRRPSPRRDDRVVGACFTGGVDSFHSLVENRGRVGALVYGFGLDVPTRESAFVHHVTDLLRAVATEEGVRLLVADTNIKKLFRRADVRWGFEGHGAVLASLGTLFSPLIRTLLVPSTHSYDAAAPWGSHPLLDHRWSSPRLEVVYDGAECSRIEKTRRIAGDRVAQRFLRVCYRQFEALNCGRCPKCLRTMATLEVLGALPDFSTFTGSLDLERVRDMEIRASNDAVRLRDVQRFAMQHARHGALAAAIDEAVVRYETEAVPDTAPDTVPDRVPTAQVPLQAGASGRPGRSWLDGW